MRRRHVLLLAVLAVGGLPSVGLAQPVGREFRVNTYTTEDQGAPSISSSAAGTFIVVWQSSAFGAPDQDGSEAGLFGQRYDSAAEHRRLGSEFQVNTYTTASQQHPSVVSDPAGNFVVVWESYGQDGSGYGIFGQRFRADGSPLGGEFQVNTYTTDRQRYPAITSDPAGNFVVVWESRGQDGSDEGIFGQRYRSDGSLLGGEFQVNTHTTDRQRYPAVASDPAGDFIVVWERVDGDGIFGQRYRSDGTAIGDEFQVNTNMAYDQQLPAVAANDSGFVVVWGNDAGYYYLGVSGQRYDRAGSRIGDEFRVSTFTEPGGVAGYYAAPQVAYDASGNFVVVWSYAYRTTDLRVSKVLARPYDTSGNPVANERRVNIPFVYKTESNPKVATSPDGNFIVVWGASGNEDVSARRIRGQ